MFHGNADRREFDEALRRVVTAALSAHADEADAEQFLVGQIRERIAEIQPTMPRAGSGRQTT